MKKKMFIKMAINRMLRRIGIEVRRLNREKPDTKRDVLKILCEKGIQPKTVIDVGVHYEGTPELYETFPDSKHILIEPVKEFESDILKICNKIEDVEYIRAAASNKSGFSKLEIKRTEYIHAGIVGDIDKSEWSINEKDCEIVEVITLDELVKNKKTNGPYLIKVDIDGGRDIQVVQGSINTLKDTDCVIIEALFSKIGETIVFLEKNGFYLWSIVDISYRNISLLQVDLVFLNNAFQKNPQFLPWGF
jgi:FkbM family methyltransferase